MTMNSEPSASETIASYRKRQQRGPIIIWAIAALLVVVGIIILIVWLTGNNKPKISLFATKTPTPTLTSTATQTSTPTATATITLTPSQTFTPVPPTASAPFYYEVQEGEFLYSIVEKFNLGDDGILLLYALNPTVEAAGGNIYPGQKILIPNPGMELPTATPIPADLPQGTLLDYTVRPGDSIAAIAVKFRSTEDAILKENEIAPEDANKIQVGQKLVVPANLVTPAPTRLPPTAPADSTPTPTAPADTSATPIGGTCAYEQNEEYVTQIFELVNNERVTQGLTPLTLNEKLSKAALVHASDMACNSFFKEEGSDGSTPEERVKDQGYTASLVLQEIHAQPPEYGGDGQAAFDAWMGGTTLINPTVTEIGIAYAYSADSALGGYFTVILATP